MEPPNTTYNSPYEKPGSPYFLSPSERWWRDRQPMLEAKGYMLRPRYRPGWTPSWLGTNEHRSHFEDGTIKRDRVDNIDATRISDGAPVHIKALIPSYLDGEENTNELDVALFFSTEPLRSDPRNHCVPILDWWYIPEERTYYIVMPLLRKFDSPEFLTVGEAVDFFGQVMEGLAFMHEHYVAHRDCCSLNIMMDPTKMYPKSFHPVKTHKNRDFHGQAPHTTRTDCAPKYYLIDFGLSKKFDPKSGRWPPLWMKVHGADRSAPELNHSPNTPYDPFPTDVYYVGNLIRTESLQKYQHLEFMDTLVNEMTVDDPRQRPTIHEALSEFKTLRESLSSIKLRPRLVRKSEFPIASVWRTGKHLIRSARWVGSRIPAVPSGA